MAYSADTFVADEQPTTAKWNKLWSNDASFNDGTGIGDNAILNRHVLADNLYASKVYNPYKFSVYRNAAQNSGSGAFVKVNFDTELFDTGSNFDNATNYRFTAPVAGFYDFAGMASTASAPNLMTCGLYKNGTELMRGTKGPSSAQSVGTMVAGLMQLAASDYVELYVYSSSTVALEVGASVHAYMTGYLESST